MAYFINSLLQVILIKKPARTHNHHHGENPKPSDLGYDDDGWGYSHTKDGFSDTNYILHVQQQ
jgi:hypothetical protein